ncbi:hypothetical protein [Streptomyces sp. UG1]|uniref:hypothetical protein n=1 Tax=Streptomyces sp. UG1 TaxID=3417652 RepID=UPI003CFACBA5
MKHIVSSVAATAVGSAATTVLRAEVEKHVRENHALPLTQHKPKRSVEPGS